MRKTLRVTIPIERRRHILKSVVIGFGISPVALMPKASRIASTAATFPSTGGSLDGLQRLMEKFVNQALRQSFHGGLLFRGEALQAASQAAKLRAPDLFRRLLQLHNLRPDIQCVHPSLILVHLGQNHGFGQLRFPAAFVQVRARDRLQIVNVVEEDAIQLVDFGVDVAWHSDVDKEHGPARAAAAKSAAHARAGKRDGSSQLM